MSLNDMADPPDWEELSARLITDRDPLAYPINDVVVSIVPRKLRTLKHVMPEEDLYFSVFSAFARGFNAISFRCDVPLHVRECVRCHTSDWIAVDYRYRNFSSSNFSREKITERNAQLQIIPRQDYEVDIDTQNVSTPSEELTLQVF
jgi:dedicator of cytokinesis protein 6/7/8